MERRLHLRVQDELPLKPRIHRLAEAALALRKLDYLGRTCEGPVRERILALTEAVLRGVESRQEAGTGSSRPGTPDSALPRPLARSTPERVKTLRQAVIAQLEAPGVASEHRRRLELDMEDLFFVMQLYSYRGDYLDGEPTVERLAETVDKLEEDVLGRELPTVRGSRRVRIEFGAPRQTGAARGRQAAAELTDWMQQQVQQLVDRGLPGGAVLG